MRALQDGRDLPPARHGANGHTADGEMGAVGGRIALRAGCHAPDVGDRERALVHRLDEVRAVDHRPQVDVGSHGLEPQGVDESRTDGDERTRE